MMLSNHLRYAKCVKDKSEVAAMEMLQEESGFKDEFDALLGDVPFAPCATSYGMGWKGLQAVHYCRSPNRLFFSTGTALAHVLVLTIRPPEKMDLEYEGVKQHRPPPVGSIYVVPAGCKVLARWQGSLEALVIFLEPRLVAKVAAESFELDPNRTPLPPLYGLNVPALRSAMLAVDYEMRFGGQGKAILVKSLANVLSIHLIRQITKAQRLPA
jgi:AraC family transcriptional regulator